ncbi:MAG: tetratricopeptide repeat protein [Curvibacter sp.]
MKHRFLVLSPLFVLAFSAVLGTGAVRAADYTEIRQLLRDGKLGEAQSRVDRQLAAQPKDVQLRLYKGVIQRELGRPNEALATFSRLSDEHPDLPEPHNNMAAIYAAQGQLDKARIALEKALRTHPSYATAHDNLAEVYARLASQAYTRALQIEGGPPAEPARLALIRELPLASGAPVRTAPVTAQAQTVPVKPIVPPVAPPAPPVPAPPNKPAVAQGPPVAAATATPTVVKAPTAPTTPATAAATGATPGPEVSRDVEQAVRAWAKAWSDRNMSQYLAAYDAGFETPGRQSRGAWEQDRRDRILGKSRISVNLLELHITVKGDRAVAKFRQDYKADALAVLSRKTLELTRNGGRWLIVKELSGN